MIKRISVFFVSVIFPFSIYCNTIALINPVDDIEVLFNVDETEVISQLSQTTTIVDDNGGIYTVQLDWSVNNYDQITPGDYIATGTFELPGDVVQSSPPTPLLVNAVITILDPGLINIIDYYNEIEDVEVPYGTIQSHALDSLPQTITITDSYDLEYSVFLYWTINNYIADVPGTYSATGDFILPFGVDQTSPSTDLIVHTNVIVLEETFNLELEANPQDAGILNGFGDYEEGTEIHINAITNEGWKFVNWTFADGIEVSTDSSFVFTMPNEDVSLVANFNELHSLELEVNPNESAVVSGAGIYEEGEDIQISSTLNEGWMFTNWTYSDGSIASLEKDFVFTMPSENVTLTANFESISSINTIDSENIKVFHNKSNNSIEIQSNLLIENMSVYNLIGSLIDFSIINENRASVNLNVNQAGIYIIELRHQHKIFTKKILIP